MGFFKKVRKAVKKTTKVAHHPKKAAKKIVKTAVKTTKTVAKITGKIDKVTQKITQPITKPVAKLIAPVVAPIAKVVAPVNKVLGHANAVLTPVTILTGGGTIQQALTAVVKEQFVNKVTAPLQSAVNRVTNPVGVIVNDTLKPVAPIAAVISNSVEVVKKSQQIANNLTPPKPVTQQTPPKPVIKTAPTKPVAQQTTPPKPTVPANSTTQTPLITRENIQNNIYLNKNPAPGPAPTINTTSKSDAQQVAPPKPAQPLLVTSADLQKPLKPVPQRTHPIIQSTTGNATPQPVLLKPVNQRQSFMETPPQETSLNFTDLRASLKPVGQQAFIKSNPELASIPMVAKPILQRPLPSNPHTYQGASQQPLVPQAPLQPTSSRPLPKPNIQQQAQVKSNAPLEALKAGNNLVSTVSNEVIKSSNLSPVIKNISSNVVAVNSGVINFTSCVAKNLSDGTDVKSALMNCGGEQIKETAKSMTETIVNNATVKAMGKEISNGVATKVISRTAGAIMGEIIFNPPLNSHEDPSSPSFRPLPKIPDQQSPNHASQMSTQGLFKQPSQPQKSLNTPNAVNNLNEKRTVSEEIIIRGLQKNTMK